MRRAAVDAWTATDGPCWSREPALRPPVHADLSPRTGGQGSGGPTVVLMQSRWWKAFAAYQPLVVLTLLCLAAAPSTELRAVDVAAPLAVIAALLTLRVVFWLQCPDVIYSSEGLQLVRRGRVLRQVGWDDVVGLHLLATEWVAPQWTVDGPAGRGSSGLPTLWVCRPGAPANPLAGRPFAKVLLTTRTEVNEARAALVALGAARGVHVSDARQAMDNDNSHQSPLRSRRATR